MGIRRQNISGFSFIELMVYLVLALIISSGSYVIHQQIQNARSSADALTDFRRLQNELRAALGSNRSCGQITFGNNGAAVALTNIGAGNNYGVNEIYDSGNLLFTSRATTSKQNIYGNITITAITVKDLSGAPDAVQSPPNFVKPVMIQLTVSKQGESLGDRLMTSIPMIYSPVIDAGGVIQGCYRPRVQCDRLNTGNGVTDTLKTCRGLNGSAADDLYTSCQECAPSAPPTYNPASLTFVNMGDWLPIVVTNPNAFDMELYSFTFPFGGAYTAWPGGTINIPASGGSTTIWVRADWYSQAGHVHRVAWRIPETEALLNPAFQDRGTFDVSLTTLAPTGSDPTYDDSSLSFVAGAGPGPCPSVSQNITIFNSNAYTMTISFNAPGGGFTGPGVVVIGALSNTVQTFTNTDGCNVGSVNVTGSYTLTNGYGPAAINPITLTAAP